MHEHAILSTWTDKKKRKKTKSTFGFTLVIFPDTVSIAPIFSMIHHFAIFFMVLC